jgi:hypothetical protein
MDRLAHKRLGHHPDDKSLELYALDDPIPKAVLDGTNPSQQGQQLVVVEAPDLMIRHP